MEPFTPFDSEYRCSTFDSLPRAKPRHGLARRLIIGGLKLFLGVMLVGGVIAGTEIAYDWMHSGRAS